MSEIGETLKSPVPVRPFLARHWPLLRGYLSAVSGSAGRLVFSLVYFIALANTLSLEDFGLFATASAAGIVIARLLAFGFISAVYRSATKRPLLVGTYTAGFLFLSLLSLPLMAAAASAAYAVFFAGTLPLGIFVTVVVAEALLWRPFELVLIVNNGMGFFTRSALLAIAGFAIRAGAAFLFAVLGFKSLSGWALFYCAGNAASLLLGALFFYPRQKLRLRLALYRRRLPDSIYVAGAEMLFYVQSELDKLLVLALGNPTLAGLYAIVMRLVDLTAIPVRVFSMMLVQKIMRTPEFLGRLSLRVGIEAGVFAASTLGLAFFALILHYFPNALGHSVAAAAPVAGMALLVPGFRNLVEYQAELLFARGQTFLRTVNLALLAGAKGVALAYLLRWTENPIDLVWGLNFVFALLYLASLMLSYSALRLPAKRV